MNVNLLFGLRPDPNIFTTISLNNINLKSKIAHVKSEVAEQSSFTKDELEFIYCGNILEDDTTLETHGLKNGSMIHVLKKKETEIPVYPGPISDKEVSKLTVMFRLFTGTSVYRNALHRLSKIPEIIENITSSSTEIQKDPVALAMLQDPEMLIHFSEPKTIKRIAEHHPALLEAAHNLAYVVLHDEAANKAGGSSSTAASSSQSTAYSYSLDNLSDDEEMAADSSQSSDSTQQSNTSGTHTHNRITAAQLAAGLSSLGARTSSSNSSSTSSSNTNSGVITTEMFSQAMQQAIASTPTPTTAPAPAPAPSLAIPPLPPMLPQMSDLQTQLAQMHEIGLRNDAINVQALQFTNGDVQAAIELVFSGFSDN